MSGSPHGVFGGVYAPAGTLNGFATEAWPATATPKNQFVTPNAASKIPAGINRRWRIQTSEIRSGNDTRVRPAGLSIRRLRGEHGAPHSTGHREPSGALEDHMRGINRPRTIERAITTAIGVAALIALAPGGITNVAAQAPAGRSSAAERAAEAEAAAKDPRNFTGYWGMPGYKTVAGHGFEAREACAALKDPSGQPMERCDQPWEAKGGAKFGLKDFLNKRGLAWMEFRDEQMSEKHLCLPTMLPGIMDHEAGAVRMLDGVIQIQFSTDAFAEGVTRPGYMDGRQQ